MIYFRWTYLILLMAVLSIGFVLVGGSILNKEMRARYALLYNLPLPSNLLNYQIAGLMESIQNKLFVSDRTGVPIVRFYIPKKAQAALQENLPSRIKDWQQAYRLTPDGTLQKIKVRHRGDNPINWAYAKKSWRTRSQKKNLIDGTRDWIYVMPQGLFLIENHLANRLARQLGVLAPKSRMVELFINDVSHGLYEEIERLDESFLRNNQRMPVNIYKGEQASAERRLLSNRALFSNPDLWSKVAVFNQAAADDDSDLALFLNLIRRAGTSDDALRKLKRVARYDEWARFSALQVLLQSWHNDEVHNMRLISDAWTGTVSPITHDTESFFDKPERFRSLFPASHSLLALYIRSSEFVFLRQRILHSFVREGVLSQTAEYVDELALRLAPTYSRDNFRRRMVYVMGVLEPMDPIYGTVEGMQAAWKQLSNHIVRHEHWLRTQLTASPSAFWIKDSNGISLIVEGAVPVGDVTITHKSGTYPLRQIAWDTNGDGKLSDGDLNIPFDLRKDYIKLQAVWIANRTGSGRKKAGRTRFRLVADVPLNLVSVHAANALTGERVKLSTTNAGGLTPERLNRPVINISPIKPEIWAGDVFISGVQFVDRAVTVRAGTTLHLEPGSSLIFRNRVRMDGTKDNPISVRVKASSRPWGVVAFQGPATAKSRISHVNMSGGSGGTIDNIRYTAMLSVHDARDITFNHLTLRDNRKFDDMMHIVYGQDISIKDCNLQGAFADAIDVDISKVRITRCKISDAGNDAIDLMSSQVLIEDSDLVGAGDKGVSVGEDSRALIFQSRIRNNAIGVESKDGSTAHILNTDLNGNRIQVSAYQKNWRYGAGGRVTIDKSVLLAPSNELKADKHSGIDVFDSAVVPPPDKTSKRIKVDGDSIAVTLERRAATGRFQADAATIMKKWGVAGRSNTRGARP